MGHKCLENKPLRREKSRRQIYDPIRKKYVAYTPEEHVRQQLLNYLVRVKGYPKGLISVERAFVVNGQQRRYDIAVFRSDASPFLLAECKAPNVDLSPKNDALIRQVLAYYLHMQAPYLALSNGQILLCFAKQKNCFQQIADIPSWQ